MHKYAKAKEWDVLYKEAQKNKELLQSRNEFYETAFHVAVKHGAPTDVLIDLIKLKPQLLAKLNDEGMLPLHLGCEYGMSIETLLAFLKYAPESIHRVTKDNRSPLQIVKGNSIFGRCTWPMYRDDYSKVLAALESPEVLEAVQMAQETTAIKYRGDAFVGIPMDPDLRAITDAASAW